MTPGERLDDRFELEQPIGTGGMGTVFRARDSISGETVAVKILSDGQGHLAERFAREVMVLAELSHPGIVRYISHGMTASGRLFLVMEWVDGEVLKARLERGPLTLGESVTLATRVAEALGVAHARGVVHRDLNPSNLMLPGGRVDLVKVLDFGIARREGKTQLTQTGTMLGTVGYMAPEQAHPGEPIDARADVFALGCVLFECLTGVPPFDGDTTAAILAKILFGTAPRVSELWPEVPESLDALVAQLLAQDPALRPSDGANLAAALATLGPLTNTAVMAPPERAARPRATPTGERRLLAIVMLSPADPGDEPLETALRTAVASYGGRLEQLADGSTVAMLEGDRQVATDHAARAARCALAMSALTGHRPMAIAMGRTEAGSRLPEGDVIDRASRLLADMARQPGALPPIALDDVSAGLLDARFDVVESEADGRAARGTAHESPLRLGGERAVMHGARTLLGRPTSCVGRGWELGALASILDECLEEPAARVAVVTAAAGMGKSRLRAEFVGRVRERHPEVAIWVGRGDSLRAGSTLDLLAQALRGALGLHDGEPLSVRRDKLRARVAEHVPPADHDRVAAFLGELVGTPVPDDGAAGDSGAALRAARQDAQLMSEQMRRAWLDFLRAETAAHPVLLVLEDLHWGDFGTVRFIDAALRDLGKQAWMVLALARPEVFEIFPKLWADRQNVQQLRLKELGRKAGERLVRQVLGDTVGDDTVERLVKQSDGNAFYLEELIRAVAQGKDQALPETVLAMVETRLARLPFEARRVLRAASVFGEVCWDGGVITLLAEVMPAAAVAEWLAMLVEQELLVVRPDSRFPSERELAFRHALLREGAHATLTAHDEQLMHRLAGEWLEHHGEADPMVLAGHFERGGDGATAARHYLRATQQAMHVIDYQAAMARAALGLACAPPSELRIALLGHRCEAATGSQQVSLDEAEELLRLAVPGSVPWAQAMVAYIAGMLLAGRMGEILASIARLHGVTPAPGAAGSTSLALFLGVMSLDMMGQVRQGTALEQSFLPIVRARGDQEPLVQRWWHTIVADRAAYAYDDPWTALQHTEALQGIFDAIGGELIFASVQVHRGMNRWFLGALEPAAQSLEAIPVGDRSLGIASSLRRFMLSWLYADLGALAQARALATQLAEAGRAHRNRLEEGRGRWVLAEVLRRDGDLDGADREIQLALAGAVPLEQPGVRASLAALRLAQGRVEEALAAAQDAMARSEAVGGCGLFRGAFVRLTHAEALHASGAHDAAARAIADARAHLLAIADKITDPAYQASFLERVPENARTLTLADAWLGDSTP
jgi:tetratricopeptide (TPR) repeat protein